MIVNFSKYEIKIIPKQTNPLVFIHPEVIFFTPVTFNKANTKNNISGNNAG